LFAIWHAGLVAVPLNAKLHPKEVAFILDDSEATLCFVTDDVAAGVAGIAGDVKRVKRIISVDTREYLELTADPIPQAVRSRDDLAWLFYTSGTTGRPKGAMLSHLNLALMSWSYLCDFDSITEGDSFLHLGPQSHAAGLLALPHVAKAAHHILPASGTFDPSEIAVVIDRTPSVSFFAAPTMVRRLVDHPAMAACHLDHLRTIVGGGAPFHAADVRRVLQTFGPRFSNGYGQGECPCTIAALPKRLYTASRSDEYLTSVGFPRSGVEMELINTDGLPVGAGEAGEITVRSDIVMSGYWHDPEATAATLVDGWLRTGDVGVRDEHGLLWLKDRRKDLIISGGSNIYPREVEDTLRRSPGVLEVSVIGEPDAEWGERVVAFVVRRPGASVTESELDSFCLSHLARFKRPKRYVFVRELPRNSTGKVLKTELRRQLLDGTLP
jgi:acyl-CoA synthetase (AMP-forming)/AMP-acid ligase II